MTTETTTWTLALTEETVDLLRDDEHEAPALTLDPRDRSLVVDSAYGAGSGDGTPADIWHGLALRHWLPTVPDAPGIAAYLRSPAAAALLDRIAAGHEVRWDGHNHVGRLDEDGGEAWAALTAHLDTLTDERDGAGVWDAGDWLAVGVGYEDADGNPVGSRGQAARLLLPGVLADGSDLAIDADTTDDQLGAYADLLDADARREGVLLSGTYRHLAAFRDDAAARQADR